MYEVSVQDARALGCMNLAVKFRACIVGRKFPRSLSALWRVAEAVQLVLSNPGRQSLSFLYLSLAR